MIDPVSLLPRGVYEIPYLDLDGRRVLFAVDSRGLVVRRLPLLPDDEAVEINGEDFCRSLLTRILNRLDPPAPLDVAGDDA